MRFHAVMIAVAKDHVAAISQSRKSQSRQQF
jgi:hypothetical protein